MITTLTRRSTHHLYNHHPRTTTVHRHCKNHTFSSSSSPPTSSTLHSSNNSSFFSPNTSVRCSHTTAHHHNNNHHHHHSHHHHNHDSHVFVKKSTPHHNHSHLDHHHHHKDDAFLDVDEDGRFTPCWNCERPHDCANMFCKVCKKIQPPKIVTANFCGGKAPTPSIPVCAAGPTKNASHSSSHCATSQRAHRQIGECIMTHFQLFHMPQSYSIDEQKLDQTFKKLQMLLHPDRFACKSETEKKISAVQSSLVTNAYQVLKNPKLRAEYLLALEGQKVDVSDVDQEFLMDTMELMETLNEEELTQDELRSFMSQNEQEREGVGQEFNEAFAARDWLAAKHAAAKLNYLVRSRDTIYEMLEVEHGIEAQEEEEGQIEQEEQREEEGSQRVEPPDCTTCVNQEECVQALENKKTHY